MGKFWLESDRYFLGVSIWADLWPLLWSGAAMNTDHVDHVDHEHLPCTMNTDMSVLVGTQPE